MNKTIAAELALMLIIFLVVVGVMARCGFLDEGGPSTARYSQGNSL